MMVAGMRIAAVRVCLPDLDSRALHRLALGIHDAAHHVDHLALRALLVALHQREIGVLVERLFEWIEGTQYLRRGASQFFRGRNGTERRGGRAGTRGEQQASAGKALCNHESSTVTTSAWIFPSTAPLPKRRVNASVATPVASARREAPRASISPRSGVP